MQDLEIGQVVYILSEKSGNVVPAIVAEESVVRTLEGNTTSWKLYVGSEANRKVIDSKQVNGEVYGTIEEVHAVLNDRLTEYLRNTISDKKERARKWYGKYYTEDGVKQSPSSMSMNGSEKIDPDQLLESVDKEPTLRQQQQVAVQQRKPVGRPSKGGLKEMIMPSEEELKNNIITDEEGRIHKTGPTLKKLRMPDGSHVDVAVEQTNEGINILE